MVQSFDELIKLVDIVTFHVPRTDETTGMLGKDQFAMCKPELLVVNAARGGIVDEDALIAALDANQCSGAQSMSLCQNPQLKITPSVYIQKC